MMAADVGVEVIKIGVSMIGASVLETSPTIIGSIGRTGMLTLIVVTLGEQSRKGGQGVVMTVFVQKPKGGRSRPIRKTSVDPIGNEHDDPVLRKTGSRGQPGKFVRTVGSGSEPDFP